MSYTPPQYVDTKEQAILALASTIKGEAVTGGDGSVNRALDILADVLAEQDVQVPQTDAGAILALAQYVSGGGGGDFTTAELTYENGSAVPITCAALSNNPEEPAILPMIYGQSGIATVPLYKGHAYFMSGTGGTVTVSGSITAIYEGIYDISGDCSISISNVS